MKFSKHWRAELRRTLLVLLAAALLGAPFGISGALLLVAVLLLLAFWLYQLGRIQRWLAHPEEEPPESSGIWGDIFDKIYHLQRKDREARGRLQSAVDYLQDSLASMRDGVVMVGEQGAIEWSNKAVESLLGLRYPQDQGQALLNLVRVPEFHQYFLAGDYHKPLKFDTGSERAMRLQVEVTRFGAGSHLLFIRDITAFTRLEQVRRDFVGNVSHELRTPLTVITGYLETILANAEHLEQRYVKPLEQMEQQAQRMETLLKDLLWLSRIENVRALDEHEPIDMGALLCELRDELNSSHPQRRLQLEVEDCGKIRGNYRELYSAVSNLVLNAFKYSAADSQVLVQWQCAEGISSLCVADTGIGIEERHIPRLTERFYRVDDSRAAATGGTGLGLAIVKHVAVSHGARLDIESTQGVGSRFTLSFPPG